MKTLRKVARKMPVPDPRDGTTLTEVLMSILCMGIGVVAVASLFPIALLRSVQATQITSATILRFNAETLIDLNRDIIYNPDNANADGKGDVFDEHFNKTYLVDPLGWNIINNVGGTPNTVGSMSRYNLGLTTIPAAANIVTLPDSWVTMYDFIPVSNDDKSVTLEENIPQDVIDAVTDGQTIRVVLFSQNGKLSETRTITATAQISGATITWAPGQATLPANGQYFNNKISRVRIEVQERRYTWLLTVRNFTTNPQVPQALVDVVVFFRRSPSIDEESYYTLSGSGRTYVVNKVAATDPDPFLKKGGFMLDTNAGSWHRIAKVNEDTQTITLERNVTSTIPNTHRVVFMPGVVDVFRLGIK